MDEPENTAAGDDAQPEGPADVDVPLLLARAEGGDDLAIEELLPLVYSQLRAMAQQCMAAERANHTLGATALVHEAYLRLIGPRKIPWQSQAHFYSAAAEAIRRILVDHARSHSRQKRGGTASRAALSVSNIGEFASPENSEEFLALEEAVCRLEGENPEAGKIVRLRFYAGLSIAETSLAMGLPERTVDRRWSFAKAWLHRQLSE